MASEFGEKRKTLEREFSKARPSGDISLERICSIIDFDESSLSPKDFYLALLECKENGEETKGKPLLTRARARLIEIHKSEISEKS